MTRFRTSIHMVRICLHPWKELFFSVNIPHEPFKPSDPGRVRWSYENHNRGRVDYVSTLYCNYSTVVFVTQNVTSSRSGHDYSACCVIITIQTPLYLYRLRPVGVEPCRRSGHTIYVWLLRHSGSAVRII